VPLLPGDSQGRPRDARGDRPHRAGEAPPIEDLAAEVAKLKGEGARREQLFQKQFEAEKTHGKVLEKKFDELFKRAKEDPDQTPRKRDIDLD